jgi:hypothetical protein
MGPMALPRDSQKTKRDNDLTPKLGEDCPVDIQGLSGARPNSGADIGWKNAVPADTRNGAEFSTEAKKNRREDEYPGPAQSATQPASPWASLPFVGKGTARPLNFWQTQPGDDGEDDCRRGAAYAGLALAAARANSAPFLIGWIMADMIEAGRAGQLELAFIHAIAGEIPR